jgi:serine/threonine-protein kinase
MAPEQLEGREADARTDIFALGVLLYEMVTGTSAFAGGSPASLLAAILTGEPRPVRDLQPLAPPALERVLQRCLEKDPDDRWQSAADVGCELRWVRDGVASGVADGAAALPGRGRRALRVAAAVLAVAAVAGVGAGLGGRFLPPARSTPAAAGPLAHFVEPTSGVPETLFTRQVAVSADGSRMAWIDGDETFGQLCVRRLDSVDAVKPEGAEQAAGPFFSPDGDWVGFLTPDAIRRLPSAGGSPRTIVDRFAVGATWTDGGTIVFATLEGSGLWAVPAEGGEPRRLTRAGSSAGPERQDYLHVFPQSLPGGNLVLFSVVDKMDRARDAAIVDLDTTAVTTVPGVGWAPRYVGTGHIVSGRDGSLQAVPFDPARRAITGPPVTLVHGGGGRAVGSFDLSAAGTLIYEWGRVETGGRLQRIDRSGRSEILHRFPEVEGAGGPRYSPDGGRIAFWVMPTAGSARIEICDLRRGEVTRLAIEGSPWWPHWSPDGRRIAVGVTGEGIVLSDLRVVGADGTGPVERLTREDPYWEQPTSWTPDGRTLLFQRQEDPDTGWDICAVDPGSGQEPRVVLGTRADESQGQVSPDGRSLAYVSNETGRNEVYVRSWPALDRRWQVSTRGGNVPAWSRDGRELFYVGLAGMVAVPVSHDPRFRHGQETALFTVRPFPFSRGSVLALAHGRGYDVAPDGRTFVWARGGRHRTDRELHVVLNWFRALDGKRGGVR